MKPILFSTPMVQAILAGTKSQTRRIVKPPFSDWITDENIHSEWAKGLEDQCKYGQVGSVLWVRETFCIYHDPDGTSGYYYKEQANEVEKRRVKWKPSIFMPREACRLFLEITDIRVERLQDISEEDAIAEGVEKLGNILLWTYKDYLTNNQVRQYSARQSYMSLWDKINGPGSWEKNPFVWKITFKKN
jgi:hypothetical protein